MDAVIRESQNSEFGRDHTGSKSCNKVVFRKFWKSSQLEKFLSQFFRKNEEHQSYVPLKYVSVGSSEYRSSAYTHCLHPLLVPARHAGRFCN